MADFIKYRRTQIAEMRPYVPGEDMTGISISGVDGAGGSPKAGDMIARNPANPEDRWLVAALYFAANFMPMHPEAKPKAKAVAPKAPVRKMKKRR